MQLALNLFVRLQAAVALLQVDLANHLLNLLPPTLRVDLLHGNGTLKTRCVTHTVEDMIIGDPSEAVRSADIERVLKDHFEVVEDRNCNQETNSGAIPRKPAS